MTRARGSVDRASGSGPEERGFESLRAHENKQQPIHYVSAAFLELNLIRQYRATRLTCPERLNRGWHRSHRCGHRR